MKIRPVTGKVQFGLSLVGFMFVIAVVALFAVLGIKIVPSVIEYSAIKKAISTAKASGTTPAEIRSSFDKQATSGYIDSVTGKDLEIEKTQSGFEVGVAYQKKIELIGPASLVIDYVASTEDNRRAKKIE